MELGVRLRFSWHWIWRTCLMGCGISLESTTSVIWV